MLVTIILLCCFASAIAGVQPPDIPPRPPCRRGEICPDPFPINVCGVWTPMGPRCRPGLKCPLGFTCMLGQCCGERPVLRPPLPLPCAGPRCNKYRRCKSGYTCKMGRCCSNRCPKGQIQGPVCSKVNRCKPGYYCNNGVCCRGKITIGSRCPSGQFPVRAPGRCLKTFGCPKGSSCHKGTCCRPKLILPPRPRECPSGQFPVNVPGRCFKTFGCPKGSSCYKGNCCRPKKILPPGRFCPMGAGLPKFPRCPKFPTKIPLCKTDKDCGKTDKCCRDICGRRRCTKTMPFPPFGKIPL